MKIVTIIENNAITGVQYGTVEIPDTVTPTPTKARVTKFRKNIAPTQDGSLLTATQQIENIKKSRIAKIRKNNTKKK